MRNSRGRLPSTPDPLLAGGMQAASASMQALEAMDKVSFGEGLPGYVVGSVGAPGLVVLQEWWGVNTMIQQLATTLSSHGFRCLVPDLYKGKVGVDAEEASHLMSSLDFKAAIGEMSQAVAYLKQEGSPKVGAIGFCMGGALTFCAAQHCGVAAAVPFYGSPDPAVCNPASIKVPVQAHFGAADALKGFSDPETASKVVAAMQEAGAAVELFMYDGCGHAFMNALTNEGADKLKAIGAPQPPVEAPQLALERAVAFFKHHLA